MNPDYPNWTINKDKTTTNKLNLIDKIHCYNIASLFGCGRYPITTEYINMHTWMWQFGGLQKTPIYNNNKSPMICNLHILQKK